MRLTKIIRESFVRAAMQDVPQVQYDEAINKMLVENVIAQMPPDMLKAYQKHPELFNKDGRYVDNQIGYVYFPCAIKPAPEAIRAALELCEKRRVQKIERNTLEEKLRAAADSVTTRKSLVALLPEFEKYLPADEPAACKTLPAVANLLADFTKAGWPKSATKKSTK
jgi:hypothetical protein